MIAQLPRGATIEIGQLPNGYWAASVSIRLPWSTAPVYENRTELMHDAGEALAWADHEIRFAVEGTGVLR